MGDMREEDYSSSEDDLPILLTNGNSSRAYDHEAEPVSSGYPLQKGCCSLVDPAWKIGNVSPGQPEAPTAAASAAIFKGGESKRFPGAPPTTPEARTLNSYVINRAIVTIDLEQIGPEDPPHHPFDRMDVPKLVKRRPWGVTVNQFSEMIYVTDREHDTILVFGPDGKYEGKIGGPGKTEGLFNKPTGIAYDASNDQIIVADKDNHRVQAFSASTGKFLFAFGCRGEKQGEFHFPWGVAVSPDGCHIAVVDSMNHRIQIFTTNGNFVREYCILEYQNCFHQDPILNFQRGIAFNNTGDIVYVTDYNLHQVQSIDLGFGQMTNIVGQGELDLPSGIDVDSSGNLLVCDTQNNAIRIFTPKGRLLGQVVRVGKVLLDQPQDLCVMPDGHVAVLDIHGRIRIF